MKNFIYNIIVSVIANLIALYLISLANYIMQH